MSTILYSDAHFSWRDPYGLKPFREKVLRTVLEAGAKADMIIDCGDMLHHRYFDTELMAWLTGIFTDCLGDRVYKWYELAANHDGTGREITPFQAFINGCKCYGRGPTIIGREAIKVGDFLLRGWLSNEPFPESDARFLVTHARVEEWSNTEEKAFTLDYLNSLPFTKIWLGDTHQPQESGKVVSIGSLCPSSFADRNVESNFIVLDDDGYTRYWLDYPVFRVLEIRESADYPDYDYVKGNIIQLEFIGSPKFIQDKVTRQRWLSAIWTMEPHFVDEPKFKQVNEETIAIQPEIPVVDEIKQTAATQKWPESADAVAIAEVPRCAHVVEKNT